VPLGFAACGDDKKTPTPISPTATLTTAAAQKVPPLARVPLKSGEILFSGQTSPVAHGAFRLDGRYLVRFEQYAPEDPRLDFRNQTAFVADLERQAGVPAVRLFRTARASGRRTVTAHGRFLVDVSFGDFPYVLRLTPVRE
jgi:hypothetical protein